MEKHLDQSEIDSMFASALVAEPVLAKEAPLKNQAAGKNYIAYNFNRDGQINKEQMQAISTVNDLFARNLTHNLGAWLRTEFALTLVSAEQLPYSEFMERIAEMTYVCSVRLDPLDALGVLQMDLSMVQPIVDLLLGGVGRSGPMRKSTEIEEDILLSVMEIVMRELNLAWQPVGLKFALERRETEAELIHIMPMSEKTLNISFEMRMPEVQGSLNMCLPAVVLNTILRRLIGERDRPRRRSAESRSQMTRLIQDARFGAVLQFSTMRLNALELANMTPGSVLRLPLPRQAMAELRVGGLPIFHAQPVRCGEQRGVQIQAYTDDAQRGGLV